MPARKESVPVTSLCFSFYAGGGVNQLPFKQHVVFQALLSSSVVNTDSHDIYQIIFYYSWLPRIVLAIICGAALSLAGLLMQQVLRNFLVSPATLGLLFTAGVVPDEHCLHLNGYLSEVTGLPCWVDLVLF